MRWIPVLILAYVAVGLQTGLASEIRFHGIGPNLPLLIAVFVALSAPREDALLCCLVIGGMQDLATQQAPGLYALSYGVVGLFITGITQIVYREHPMTHALLTLFAGVVTAIVLWFHGLFLPAAHAATTAGGAHVPATRVGMIVLLAGALYTAVLSPVILAVLQRLRPLLGFQSVRRGSRSAIRLRSPY